MLQNLDKEAGNYFDLSQYMHACTLDMVCGEHFLIIEFIELHPVEFNEQLPITRII